MNEHMCSVQFSSVAQSCPTLQPHEQQHARLPCPSPTLSCVQFFATSWSIAHQTPLSVEFPRQEYWNGLPCPLPENLPNPGIEPTFLVYPGLAGGFFTTTAPPGKPKGNEYPPIKRLFFFFFKLREKKKLGNNRLNEKSKFQNNVFNVKHFIGRFLKAPNNTAYCS